ncbi:phospho-N-acetylmuramoyl-pentapeptide-transferase [Helicovermis profundi]|uniref:Phospho-N-acetylmuramoyl-pentapeptide-transferase n=1 Tax=Helicovermis profundi TaxID=3065157 RepID=A0AAU9E4H2_9FIRM|nr:phospho-N-acetylmuramoyl-pentapeptide-transferase [Clostridia bacterium S502]
MIVESININMFLSFIISFLSAVILAPFIIPLLKKMKFGQSIREEGPKSHQVKTGTPTMGGLIILTAILASFLISLNFSDKTLVIIMGLMFFGLVGFIDDYIKIGLKRNLGLTAKQKILGQLIVSLIIAIYSIKLGTDIHIPFIKHNLDLGIFYIPFIVFLLVGVSNSVNLTDGLDGLSSGVSIIVTLFFSIVAYKLGEFHVSFVTISITGACLGFLLFNKYPAKVFMGDVGSLALGGAIASISIVLKEPIILIIVGGIFVAETFSVILQVSYFKLTGKRIFKMSPLHHHFELSGWKETKVVKVFWLVSVLLSLIGYFVLFH